MMAVKAITAVRSNETDCEVVLEDLEKPINDRFKWAAENVAQRSEQWKQGLLSDDELVWGLSELQKANQDRMKLKTAVRNLTTLRKTYLGGM
jgi:hypothetical protein